MLAYNSFLFSIFFLAIASITDIKERIVPNKINFYAIFLGILLSFVYSISENSYAYIILCLESLLIALVFFLILYELGCIAGGDLKLFLAIASLNPTNPAILRSFGFKVPFFNIPVFSIEVFFTFSFIVAPYAAFLVIFRIDKELQKELLKTLSISVFFFALSFFAFREVFFSLSALVFIFFLIQTSLLSKIAFRKEVKITELKPGMIPAEVLVFNGEKLEKKKVFNITEAFNYIVDSKNVVANPFRARGLTEEEISIIKKHSSEIETLAVKDSLPAVPAITLAYVLLSFTGDILWGFLQGILPF